MIREKIFLAPIGVEEVGEGAVPRLNVGFRGFDGPVGRVTVEFRNGTYNI